MRDDEIAGQSLLLAQQETAHREHLHIHQLQHDRLHKRQTAAETVVTEVVSTVSVIQQVDVDSNGSTFAIQTVPVDSTADTTPTALTDASSPTTTTAASPLITNPGSAASWTPAGAAQSASSGQSSLSLQSGQSAVSAPTSTHSSFASLIVSSNSTTLISSSSSLVPTFCNSSIPSSSRSSLTYLTSSTNPSSADFSFTSTSFPYSPSSSSSQATSTSGIDGILAGGTGAASGGRPSSTAGSGSGSESGSGSSTTTTGGVIAGSVVGGLAGAAVVLFLLLFLIRWKKRNMSMLSLDSSERDGGADTSSGGGPSQPSRGMVERRSMAYAVPAALASLTGYKRSSQKTETDRTISSTAGSERGFYRVSGRKLPSVLQTGGDGYGGGIPDANTLSGSSFYRDSQGFYGGPGSPSNPPASMARKRESGIPIMRPSPARTPVTEQGPFSEVPPPLNPTVRPDQLGRSHPSQDGSHASKFTEEV